MDTAISEAVQMPWSGERNLALRAALGLREGEIGMVNQGDVVQVVVDEHSRANKLGRELRAGLGSDWTVETTRRPDGRHLITCYRDQDAMDILNGDIAAFRRRIGR